MTTGIHHITAFCADPQANVDFYTTVLGLRLIKVTINYDDPGTYHLYYGDERGTPGSVLTFFPWAGSPGGIPGQGQAGVIRFSVPAGTLEAWAERLGQAGILTLGPQSRNDTEVLTLADPDGILLELVAGSGNDLREPWTGDGVPQEMAIRGFESVELWSLRPDATNRFLESVMGWSLVDQNEERSRWQLGSGGPGAWVDLPHHPAQSAGRMGPGTIHHVAWSIETDSEHQRWLEQLQESGVPVSHAYDRTYFRSLYFREPGGVLFELATEAPGFTIDEPLETLGEKLQLPAWLEAQRDRVEAQLTPFVTRRGVAFPA